MKNNIRDKTRLNYILDAINSILEFTEGISYEEYIKDYKLRLAIIKLIEIIGEAANHISEETQERFDNIEWNILKGIRNILVHEYFGIDYKIIWKTIQTNIPDLKTKIETVLTNMKTSN